MSLPSNWTTVPITATYTGTDGVPIGGQITATPRQTRMVDSIETTVIIGRTRHFPLDQNGQVSFRLPATDDGSVQPTGYTWYIVEDFPGGSKYDIAVPAAAAGLDLSTVGPIDSSGNNVGTARTVATLQVYVDAAQAAAASAVDISHISTSDDVVEALIKTPGGSKTQAALSATIAAQAEAAIETSAYLPTAFVSRAQLSNLADPEAVASYVVETALSDLDVPIVQDAPTLAEGERGIRIADESAYNLRWNSLGLTSPIVGAAPIYLPEYVGFSFAILYEDPTTGTRTIEYGIRHDGSIYSSTTSASHSGPDIYAAGDSLTAGAGGGGTTWPGVLQALMSAAGIGGVVRNGGVGGEDSPTITARTNAAPLTMVLTGGSVPASAPVAVTLQPIAGAVPAPLLQGDGGGTSGNLWTEHGPVPGSLSRTGSTYYFTRTTPGSAIACTRPAAFRYDFGNARRGDIVVIAIGQNGPSDARAIADAQSIIRELKAQEKRWLVLSRPSTDDAADLLYDAAFGRHHIAVRKYLVTYGLSDAGITPTTQDQTDIANGVVPTSLRSDSVHGTPAYYTIVGNLVFRRLSELEYI